MINKVAKALMPPPGGKDPTRWRWKVWVTLMMTISVLAFHISAEKGLIAGIDAVAHTSDVRGIEDRLDTLESKQNMALRLQLAAEICRVFRQRDAELNASTRRLLNNSFSRLQEEYAAVNSGIRYFTVECSTKE